MQSSKSSSFNFQKLPSRYASIVLPFFLSIIMTFIVSCISTLRSMGLEQFSFHTWISAWGISWLIAFPVLLLVLPIVRKITMLLVRPA
ncbi:MULTISPECIES: DUF2798 domain-containing protein [unclassified Acinetobacter]|uniref:DUF2798 domain-containing protein n=1 Tax=unclassified Acinetobacter TaxID=196816 RepID=UPI002446FB83|nr:MULTISPECIES: DUF2798 domain-containing protein [unclassified Acinetobacter]MDH0031162.1 DUF2798 domain-containing protein [Acinetobacter sp. GD04021]MDH0886748.1 DUF2798 domain-containing protein [Acinetobacter sp. GD03873]MDH1083119.1 DUF2798 domain-containing protein [Acinetobacter sp. GD03983]MDH2189368.1 DUF2798 domain-containing protein [Acinetobacter sp. GD03645]MDH2202825.1 DUF2798 domain-containing protein [Acinetobacter sp. GD03647]